MFFVYVYPIKKDTDVYLVSLEELQSPIYHSNVIGKLH